MRFEVIKIDNVISQKLANVVFVCMCLVVALHVHVVLPSGCWRWWVHATICEIGDVAVPLFFSISGFLLAGHFAEQGWWGREFHKRLKTLLVPYVFWNFLFLVFMYVLTMATRHFGVVFSGGEYEGLSRRHFLLAIGLNPNKASALPYLWFVRWLLWFVLIGPFFLFVKKKIFGAVVLGVLLVLYAFMPLLLPPSPDWRVHFLKYAWMKGALFFSAGAYLRWHGHDLGRMAGGSGWAYVVAGLVVSLVSLKVGWGVDRWLAVPLLMIGVWKCVPSTKLPKWVTSSAFPIFLSHYFVLVLLTAAYRVFGLKEIVQTSFVLYLAQIPVVTVICIGMALLLRKWAPTLACIAFGGR